MKFQKFEKENGDIVLVNLENVDTVRTAGRGLVQLSFETYDIIVKYELDEFLRVFVWGGSK
jgi:hypothetical protein